MKLHVDLDCRLLLVPVFKDRSNDGLKTLQVSTVAPSVFDQQRAACHRFFLYSCHVTVYLHWWNVTEYSGSVLYSLDALRVVLLFLLLGRLFHLFCFVPFCVTCFFFHHVKH